MQTFLFTDIEASTRHWEEQPVAMASALARHDSIMTGAIDRAQGTLLKTTGDGVIARFDSAGNAVAATLDAQKALSAEAWGVTGPLRVRMGIHAGETESRNGDFFGPSMNRAARIMAAGHGGQVLVSGAAAELAAEQLPHGAALRDLGMHRLKDLTLPEHLYQLVHPDIESEFPAPVTLDSRPHNLPLQATEFLGRRNELAAIQVMLESPNTRLLTIAGPGGAGKTRLGLQVAAEQLDRFRDGVFFVDLSAELDPGSVFEAIVRTLELPVLGGGDALQILKSRLRDLEMMLVLDNFEQVTEAAVGLSELLQHAPHLRVVVTSRETLRVRAEHVFPVPPLSLPHPRDPVASIAESEAVQLFTERAVAVRPAFTLTEENAAVVAEICLRLDGLPLAIELAAARLKVFTPTDLLDRLRKRLDVLGAGGRDLPDRQRTLWGAIGWSYELLNEDERRLFELMSVFSTTDLPGLEAVASDMDAGLVLDSLASLVDKSLVRSDDDVESQRFAMLLMIKEFAAERLADTPDREAAVRKAHADYFSRLTVDIEERLEGPERDAALEDVESEIGNLRTAWRFWVDAGDLDRMLDLIGRLWSLYESKGWYHSAIELASDTLEVMAKAGSPPELAPDELVMRTMLARTLMAVRGYDVEVEAEFKRALEISRTVHGSASQRFPVLRALATYYMGIADFAQGMEYGREILELGERENDLAIQMEGHYVYGVGMAFTGDLEHGLPHLDRAIELHDPRARSASRFRLGPNTGVVARVASGLVLWQCGDLEQSVSRVSAALDIAREIDHPYSIAYALYHNAFLALQRSRFEECIAIAKDLAEVSEDHDYIVWATLAIFLEGICRTVLGETERGLEMTERAIDLYQGLTTPPVFWPLILAFRALVHALAGQPERALALIEEAITIGGPDDMTSPEFRIVKGDILRMLSTPDHASAEDSYQSAIRGAHAGGLRLFELQAMTRLVGLRRELGQSPDGSAELATLYGTFTEGLDEHDLAAARDILELSGH